MVFIVWYEFGMGIVKWLCYISKFFIWFPFNLQDNLHPFVEEIAENKRKLHFEYHIFVFLMFKIRSSLRPGLKFNFFSYACSQQPREASMVFCVHFLMYTLLHRDHWSLYYALQTIWVLLGHNHFWRILQFTRVLKLMTITTSLVLSHIVYSSTTLLIGIPWTSTQAGLMKALSSLVLNFKAMQTTGAAKWFILSTSMNVK